jgi:hypothetical protein
MTHPTDPAREHQSADTVPPIPELCCYCGRITREPVLVDHVHTPSGAGRAVYACPEHAERGEL